MSPTTVVSSANLTMGMLWWVVKRGGDESHDLLPDELLKALHNYRSHCYRPEVIQAVDGLFLGRGTMMEDLRQDSTGTGYKSWWGPQPDHMHSLPVSAQGCHRVQLLSVGWLTAVCASPLAPPPWSCCFQGEAWRFLMFPPRAGQRNGSVPLPVKHY